jgi:hypothetical protein
MFTFLAPGQVPHEANELPLPFEHHLSDRELHRECAFIRSLAHDDAPHPDDLPFSGGEIMTQVLISP